MQKTDNPDVKVMTVDDLNARATLSIYMGPDYVLVETSVWPTDADGKVTDIGKKQTVSISRYELIGMAYEILEEAKK